NGLLSAEEHIVDKANCAGAGVFMLYGGETPGKVEFDVYNGGESPMGGASLSRIDDGLWHLVTGTYDGSNVRIYVDGNQENAVSMTGPAYSRTYPVQVGGECDGNNLFWDGAVDEVRIYNRALSAAEIKALYSSGK
ncbi:MAG: LamG domain-containing protein, partial [Candidatus Moraniibacteriota bacterium]